MNNDTNPSSLGVCSVCGARASQATRNLIKIIDDGTESGYCRVIDTKLVPYCDDHYQPPRERCLLRTRGEDGKITYGWEK